MNAVAALLARAKAACAAAPVVQAAFARGDRVELDVAGVITCGVVAFVEDGWIFWCDDARTVHATPQQHLTRTT